MLKGLHICLKFKAGLDRAVQNREKAGKMLGT